MNSLCPANLKEKQLQKGERRFVRTNDNIQQLVVVLILFELSTSALKDKYGS